MKKFLALILALLLVFSMAAMVGCAEEAAEEEKEPAADDAADKEEEKEPAADKEEEKEPAADEGEKTVQEMLDAGEEVLVVFCNNNADEMVMNQVASLETRYPELGVTFQFAYNEETAEQMTLIENFITMGAKQIIFGCNDPSAFGDIVARGMAEGVQFISYGNSSCPYDITAMCNTSGKDAGMNMSYMILAWLDERYPDAAEGSIGACQTTNSPNSEDPPRNEAIKATLFADPRIDGTDIYMQDTIYIPDQGYTFAEEALTYNPDIRVFVGYTEGVAMGISNYITGRGDLNVDEYGAFGAGYAEGAVEMINMAEADPSSSCLRGLVTLGDPAEPGRGLFETSYGLLMGEIEGPNYMGFDIMGVITYLDYEYTNMAN